jgi:hypothetical protein
MTIAWSSIHAIPIFSYSEIAHIANFTADAEDLVDQALAGDTVSLGEYLGTDRPIWDVYPEVIDIGSTSGGIALRVNGFVSIPFHGEQQQAVGFFYSTAADYIRVTVNDEEWIGDHPDDEILLPGGAGYIGFLVSEPYIHEVQIGVGSEMPIYIDDISFARPITVDEPVTLVLFFIGLFSVIVKRLSQRIFNYPLNKCAFYDLIRPYIFITNRGLGGILYVTETATRAGIQFAKPG